MYKFIFGIIAIISFWACSSSKSVQQKAKVKNEAVTIANDSLSYEIIIIDIGFKNYLITVARPMTFYTVDYLENKNKIYVSEWNNRFREAYKPNLYENIIDYDYNKHYGLEVNYKLYNYFKYVEKAYGERF